MPGSTSLFPRAFLLLFSCSCTFNSAEQIRTEFKYCQKTATARGDMLLSKHQRAVLAAATRLCEDGFLVNYLKKQRQEGKGQLT